MLHKNCAKESLELNDEVTNIFYSKFAQFVENELSIFKIRVGDTRLFSSSLSSSRLIEYSKREFKHGKMLQKEIYQELIDISCLKNNSICNVAIKMSKIPHSSRIDNIISQRDFTINDIDIIVGKLKTIYKTMPEPYNNYNYCQGLLNGNTRIIESILKHGNKKEYNFFLKAWHDLDNKTIILSKVLQNRQSENKVKILHGDLSFQNTFIHNGEYIIVDPCVAFIDMYTIDILYQFSDVIVELLRFKLSNMVYHMIQEYKNLIESEFSKELLDFYFYRHSLIRATVNWLFDSPLYYDYLNIIECYDI